MTGEGYLFDNVKPEAETRFAGLEASFDHLTAAHLAARGVGAGWHCLEVGAGGGSIARWLAAQVGSDGSVLATDIDTRWLAAGGLRQIEVRRHDIAEDPLPADSFDLIHARLVLVHLAARDAVIARLVAALKAQGWLVVEDFDSALPHCLDPVSDDEQTFAKVGRALVAALHRRGADTTYPRTLPRRLSRGRAGRDRRIRSPALLPGGLTAVGAATSQHRSSRPVHGRRGSRHGWGDGHLPPAS